MSEAIRIDILAVFGLLFFGVYAARLLYVTRAKALIDWFTPKQHECVTVEEAIFYIRIPQGVCWLGLAAIAVGPAIAVALIEF